MERIKRVNRIKQHNQHNKIDNALLSAVDSKEKLDLCFDGLQSLLEWQKTVTTKILLHAEEFKKIEEVLKNRIDYIQSLEKRIEKLESRKK